jgi:hypothetical protein
MVTLLVHGGTHETGFDDDFIGAFSTTTANGPTRCLERTIIVHQLFSSIQVVERFYQGQVGVCPLPAAQVRQQTGWSFVFEAVQFITD